VLGKETHRGCGVRPWWRHAFLNKHEHEILKREKECKGNIVTNETGHDVLTVILPPRSVSADKSPGKGWWLPCGHGQSYGAQTCASQSRVWVYWLIFVVE